MAKENESVISSEQQDALSEITNIGAGNAATALSHMLGKKIQMSVPEAFVGKIEDIQRMMGDSTDKVTATFFKVHGDINGAMVMLMPAKSSLQFVEYLTENKYKSLSEMGEDDISSLKEMGNILLGASVTALNKFLNVNLLHTIPDIAIDMLGAIMDSVLLELEQGQSELLVFKVKLNLEGNEDGTDLFYFFDPVSSKHLLDISTKNFNK